MSKFQRSKKRHKLKAKKKFKKKNKLFYTHIYYKIVQHFWMADKYLFVFKEEKLKSYYHNIPNYDKLSYKTHSLIIDKNDKILFQGTLLEVELYIDKINSLILFV